MSDLIRTDNIFGKRANIVGNISADLVLESLGKVYIKSRNSAKTLEEVIKSVALGDINTVGSRTKVVEGLENLDIESVKEGELIYDKLSNILYIWIDGESIELINVAPDGTGYVKRSGDTMTGPLTINVESGPPLHVNSTELVPNLNANYLQGESAAAFTRRTRDENITGKWAFRNITEFHNNASFSKDIVLNGSIGTPYFASGFGGSGWRLDAETNTLTVDNLIVRKLMQVYELVVNKISATNGSLWVTNAGKVKYVLKLPVYTADLFVKDTLIATASSLEAFVKSLLDKTYFVILPEASSENTFMLKGADIMSSSGVMPAGKGRNDEIERRYTASALANGYVVLIKDLESVATFTKEVVTPEEEGQDPYDIFYYKLNTLFQRENPDSGYATHSLYDVNFKHDVELPIVTKDFYEAFKVSEEYRAMYENMTSGMSSTDTKHIDDESIVSTPGNFTKDLIKQALVTKARGLAGTWPGSNTEFLNPASTEPKFITYVKSYYKYYQTGNYYLVTFDDDALPVFKPGDLLRCLKWTHGGIKYYDAIVCNYIDNSSYILQVADLNFDVSTVVTYDDSLEPTIIKEQQAYNQGLTTTTNRINTGVLPENPTAEDIANAIIGIVEKEDSLVLMGNLWDAQRQNAVYITSVDDGAPYMDVLSGINRPDFSVNYYTPIYNTIKLYKKSKYSGIGLTNLDIPYTGDYYILDGSKTNSKAEFVLGDYTYNNTKYRVLVNLSSVSNISNPIYLSTLPNDNTLFTGLHIYGELLTEDDCIIISEDETSAFIREETYNNLRVNASKTTKVRVGKLDGIRDDMFPVNKQPYGYGLYGSNVFLIGEFYLSNGRSLAEISLDAINFAIATESTMNNSINLVRLDLSLASTTLESNIGALDLRVTDNYYTKSALKTAGMTIINPEVNGHSYPSIALWGNYIMLATSLEELNGTSVPAAMFYKGRIRSKFLEIDEVHNTTPLFKIDGVGAKNLPTLNYLNYWTGGTRLYRHTYYINIGTTANPDYLKSCEYIREFTHDGDVSFWAVVDLKGNPILKNGSIQYPSIYNVTTELKTIDGGGIYDKIVSVTIKEVNKDGTTIVCTLNDDFFTALNAEEDNQGDLHQIISNFKAELNDLYPVLWSLEANGSGNLGGDSFVWDTEGNVTMTGTIYADAGRIGGFNLSSNKMYSRKDIGNDPTYFYLANDTTLPCVFLSTQHSTHNTKGLFTCKSLTFQDYYISDSSINQVMLNTEGLTWTKSGIKMGAQSIIASIMVMPVWCGNDNDRGMIPYVVVSAADSALRTVDVCMGWNSWDNPNMGLSVVCFPELDSDISKSAFIANGIRTGKITINVTSLQQIELSEGRYTTVKTLISGGTFNPDTRSFKDAGNSRVGIRNLCFASGSTAFGIPYTGDLRGAFKARTILQANEYGNGLYTFYKDRTSNNTVIKNYIELWAGDDDSPNSAGYFINIVYNNYIANTDTYMDLLDIIDSLNSGKTSEEVRAAYESYYNSTLYEYNMWSTNIARLLNKYDELSTKYSTQLSNLNTALNNYHDVYDQSDIWYEGNETLTTLRNNLEEARQVVSDIYQLEVAKDNWLSKLDSAYELTTELQATVTASEYSDLLSKYNLFDYQCTYANLNDDWLRSELSTTYKAWALKYSQLVQAYSDVEVQMEIPQDQN